MIVIEEKMKELSMFAAQLYFVERDYLNLSFYLAEDITWIGTGKNEICLNKREAEQFFEKEKEVFDGDFEIMEQWFDCRLITEETCHVMAVLRIKLNLEEALLPYETLRFTVIWRKDIGHDNWKIVHVHNSISDSNVGEESYFNLSIAESNYQSVKESIRMASHTDTLTQINNAQGFEVEVGHLLEENPGKKYAVIEFGIKNFRFVNRRHSFAVGDEVLMNIAKNMAETLQEGETCARMEKDNFAMLYQVTDAVSLEKRLRSIKGQLVDPSLREKVKVEIQLRAGIYMVQDNQESVKDMLDKALMALQSLKYREREQDLALYNEDMLDKQYFHSKVLEEAPKAMENDEFSLYIQPQFDIRTKRIIAGEALTRWNIGKELRMPDQFIPVFEENGIILAFDFYMLEKVCKQLRTWLDKGFIIAPISINQSQLHIQEKNYLQEFCRIVDKYDLPHDYIAFELTESAFIKEREKMTKVARDLHQLGFQLAIDDFGTGYASLNLLTEIAADVLKIDKELLNDCGTNPRSKVVIETIIKLAHQLDMVVIAEGIETEKQLEFLRKLNCDMGQGFLVGKPTPAKDFMDNWIKIHEQEALGENEK